MPIARPVVRLLVFSSMSIVGCTALLPLRTSAIMIGNPKELVRTNARATLGDPIDEFPQVEGRSDISALEYHLTTDANMVVWFYRDRVMQVNLKEPDGQTLGVLPENYATRQPKSDDPRGYLITTNGVQTTLRPLYGR